MRVCVCVNFRLKANKKLNNKFLKYKCGAVCGGNGQPSIFSHHVYRISSQFTNFWWRKFYSSLLLALLDPSLPLYPKQFILNPPLLWLLSTRVPCIFSNKPEFANRIDCSYFSVASFIRLGEAETSRTVANIVFLLLLSLCITSLRILPYRARSLCQGDTTKT